MLVHMKRQAAWGQIKCGASQTDCTCLMSALIYLYVLSIYTGNIREVGKLLEAA